MLTAEQARAKMTTKEDLVNEYVENITTNYVLRACWQGKNTYDVTPLTGNISTLEMYPDAVMDRLKDLGYGVEYIGEEPTIRLIITW